MIRPTWQGDDLQEQILQEAVDGFDGARKQEDEAWKKAQRAREAGVPDTVICNRAEVSRATLNRRLGPRPDGAKD